jgi:hypothetical protein
VAKLRKLGTRIEFCWKCLPEKVHLVDAKGEGRISLYSYVLYRVGFRGSEFSKAMSCVAA